MRSQLEIDFVNWLRKLSCDVEVRYSRSFETNEGDCDQSLYCTECVQIERWKRKHAKSKFIRISGWDEAETSDSLPFCDRCGCVLECSPTNYFIENDIEWIETADEMDSVSAHSFWNWLSGMGEYNREEHWPQIKPHAERLMRQAGQDVVPDGQVRYVPASPSDWFPHDTIWFAIYQHFAKHLVQWMYRTKKGERGFLVNTTGRNVHHFHGMTKPEEACRCVEQLLQDVGDDSERGEFLASIGLCTAADLDKPILLPDERCTLPTFDVRGRVLKKSPNEFHPEAVVVTHAELYLNRDADEWAYLLYYSDKHWERTSWNVEICQNDVVGLPAFCDAVRQHLDEVLIEAGPDDQWRSHRLKQWDKVYESLGEVFSFSVSDVDAREKLTDALMGIPGVVLSQHRVPFTDEVSDTMFRWVAESVANSSRKKAKR